MIIFWTNILNAISYFLFLNKLFNTVSFKNEIYTYIKGKTTKLWFYEGSLALNRIHYYI